MARHTRAHSARSQRRRRCVRLGRRLIAASTLRGGFVRLRGGPGGDRLDPTRRLPASAIRSCSRRARIRSTSSSPGKPASTAASATTSAPSRPSTAAAARAPCWRRCPPARATMAARTSRMARINAELAAAGLPAGLPRGQRLSGRWTRSSPRRSASPSCALRPRWPAAAAPGRRISGSATPAKASATSTYWNLGCAMQSNVAAQVADPVDLVRGRTEGRLDPIRRAQGHRRQCARARIRRPQWRQEGTKINQGVGELIMSEANGHG